MKTKRVEKRLALKKITVADLNRDEMKAILGGEDTCGSCASVCFCSTIFTIPKKSIAGTCVG